MCRLFEKRAVDVENQELLAAPSADHHTESELQEKEAAFGTEKDGRREIARKQTIVSDVNPDFVADSKLWQWMESALEPTHLSRGHE